MAETAEPLVVPAPTVGDKTKEGEALDSGFVVIVWNDPVNLMDYVTHVFMRVFGWNRQKAETHMMEVHQKGKSVVARETFEKAEYYVHQLQSYHLEATMEKSA